MSEQSKLQNKIESAVTVAVSDPTVPAKAEAIPAIVAAISQLVPEIVNATNKEPFYQSRVFWGSALSVLAGVLALFGVAFPAEMQTQVIGIIMAALPLLGGLYALYGRFKAKKPIGQ